jgi:hypothetical protein
MTNSFFREHMFRLKSKGRVPYGALPSVSREGSTELTAGTVSSAFAWTSHLDGARTERLERYQHVLSSPLRGQSEKELLP